MPTSTRERPPSVMGRALLLLEPFRDRSALTLTEIAAYADLPRSSAHRMLAQLVDVGWLHRRGTVYHLGPKLAELGSLAQHHDRVHRAAIATMHALHRATGAIVHLTVLDADELLCLEKIGGRWADWLASHSGRSERANALDWGQFLIDHRNGGPAGPHTHTVTTLRGESAHLLSLAFTTGRVADAATPESGALTLTRPGESPRPGDLEALTEAVRAIEARLAGTGPRIHGGPHA